MSNYNIELSQLARNVSVSDTTQFVGIGTTLPDAKLHIGPNENSDIALQADGNVRVGFSSTTNYLAFHGTYLDGSLDPGVDENSFHLYTHTFIAERVYDDIYRNDNPNPDPNLRVGQKSELLLFKGNDPYPFTGANREPGADRIRLAGAEIHIDTYSHPIPSGDLRTVEDAATHDNLYQRLVVTGPGDVGIGTTLPTARVHIAKNTTPGADISTVGDIALQADGNVRVGFSTTSNYIAFHGTWWDGVSSPGVQQVSTRVPYTHTYVGERIYNYPENAELLLYKGNDNHSQFGTDRIRYLSGKHEFQLIFDDDTVGTFEEVGNFVGVTTALIIDGIGETGVTTTTVFGNFEVNGNIESDLTVSTGNSITGSGIGLTGTIDAPDGTYGSSSAALQITVADGRITNVSTSTMTTGVSNIAEVVIHNDNISVGTAGTINFGSNLTASPVSEGISTISVSGSLFSYDQASNQLQQSTGTNVTLPLAGTGNNQDGLLSHEDKSKLDGIELGATADQTASEIKTAYESNADTNVFTDSEKSKLSGIELGAGVFVATNLSYNNSTRVLDSSTGSGVTLPLAAANSNDGLLSSSDKDKLDGIDVGAQVNVQADWNAASGDAQILNKPTIPTNNNQLTNGAGYVTANTQLSNEQVQDIVGGMVTGNTESGITVTYQDGDGTLDFSVASQTDNNFTSVLKNKLDNIDAGAQVNVATDLSYNSSTRLLSSSTGNNVTLPLSTANGNSGLLSGSDKDKLDNIDAGAQVNVATNLSYNSSTRELGSSTGNNVTLPLATANSNDGLLSGSDQNKLNNIQTGAQVNVATDLSYNSSTRLLSSSTGNDVTLPLAAANSNDGLLSSSDQNKLDNIQPGAEVNVQADWTATSGDAQILNKPTLGTAAATSSTDYATAAQGALADTSSQVISVNTTFYVSGSAGNDNNDGLSSNSQWQTIQKAADYLSARRLKSGVTCTVLIAAGTYTFTSNLQLGHPQGSQIIYVGATPTGTKPRGTALKGSSGSAIRGNTSASQTYNNSLLQAYYNTIFQFNNANGFVIVGNYTVVLKNILIRGNAGNLGDGQRADCITTLGGGAGGLGGSVDLINCAIHNFSGRGLALVFGGNATLKDLTITNCRGGIDNTSGTILGDVSSLGGTPKLTISNCEGGGVGLQKNASARIEECMVSNNGGVGFNVQELSTLRANNSTVSNNGENGVYSQLNGLVIVRDSTVSNNGFGGAKGAKTLGLRATDNSYIDFRESTLTGNKTATAPAINTLGSAGSYIAG
jgi:hypothetical protein